MDKTLVSTAKPKIAGAVFVAPLGTTLPTDAKTTLDTKFKNLGYVSEEGFVITTSTSSEPIKEWGGTLVDESQTEKTESAKLTSDQYGTMHDKLQELGIELGLSTEQINTNIVHEILLKYSRKYRKERKKLKKGKQ